MPHRAFRWSFGFFAFLGLLVAAGPARPQTAAPAATADKPPGPSQPTAPRNLERIRAVDVKHIKAELAIDARKRVVRGTVTHTLSPLGPYLRTVELDCGPRLKVERVSVGPDKAPCRFTVQGETLSVKLDAPRGPDDEFDLAVTYSGTPEKGIHFVLPDPAYPEKALAIWTQGEAEDNHFWLPCYDYPNDRATSEMIVTVEKPLFVVSNGRLLAAKSHSNHTTTYHWKMDVPHSSYLISLAIAEFAVYHDKAGDVPLDYYVLRNVDEATARRFLGKTPRMIEFFAEKTGRPYPYSKYAQAVMPEFGGGMENISATTMTDRVLRDEIAALEGDADGLVAHELAHQWFGDLLTCKDWSHIWLNEGFATYFDALFAEHDRGEDDFRMEMQANLRRALLEKNDRARPLVSDRYKRPDAMFDSTTYAKGGCVLHMLRGLLGDEAWWKGIRGYVAAHPLRLVETGDFQKAMEQASGKDLKWFFDQWAHRGGHPVLKANWRYEEADKTVRVHVRQTQKIDEGSPAFRLPTTIEIAEGPGRVQSVPIAIDGPSQEFVVSCPSRPKMVRIDPKSWLIADWNFSKSDDEHVYQLEHCADVVGRVESARALAGKAKDRPEIARALAAAWKREKVAPARREMVRLMAQGGKNARAALIEAARDPDARTRVAALEGLAKLERDDALESILRAAWSNEKEAYGARRAALAGLVEWKVKDAPELLGSALKLTTNHHRFAAEALRRILKEKGSRAREQAVIYSRYGQPPALRSVAVGAIVDLATDDPSLQSVLVSLVDDPDRSIRFRAIHAARELKLVRAVPKLKALLERESGGFSAEPRRLIESVLADLEAPAKPGPGPAKGGPKQDQANGRPTPSSVSAGLSALETAAAELERQAGELRKKIAELKSSGAAGAEKAASSSASNTAK